jgi:threonine dehydrogenase-like Zn-dependent dehydrogenase
MTHTEDVFPFNWGAMYEKLPRMMVINSARANEVVDSVRVCVDLVAQGRLDFSYLVTHRLPFDKLHEAYDLYSAKKDNSIKVLMSM